jgi:hypothetical protein
MTFDELCAALRNTDGTSTGDADAACAIIESFLSDSSLDEFQKLIDLLAKAAGEPT